MHMQKASMVIQKLLSHNSRREGVPQKRRTRNNPIIPKRGNDELVEHLLVPVVLGFVVSTINLCEKIRQLYILHAKQNGQMSLAKITQILHLWVSEFPPFGNERDEFILRLSDFENELAGALPSAEAEKLKRLQLPLPVPVAEKRCFLPSNGTKIKNLNPRVVATHMTLIDLRNWKAVPYQEFLHRNHMSPAKSPHLEVMKDACACYSAWVLTEVLRPNSARSRATAVERFIDICSVCLELNNYQSSFAIVCALKKPAVGRLKATWKKVSKKHLNRFLELGSLVDRNPNPYSRPVIPHIGRIFDDIDERGLAIEGNRQCELEKMASLFRAVQALRSLQEGECRFEIPKGEIPAEDLTPVKFLTEEQANERSQSLEPSAH